MSANLWFAWLSLPMGPPRRRRLCQITGSAEICEERILLSASVPTTSGHSRTASTPPRVVRDASTGGPNGTAFLSSSETPANPVQVQATGVPALAGSMAPVVTSLGSLTPTPTVPANLSATIPIVSATSIDQMSGPQSGEDFSAAGNGGYTTNANNAGVNTATQYASGGDAGLNEPLLSIDLSPVFTPAIDLSVSSSR